MKIREVTIDGFKSYSKPITVKGFHPEFSCVTGPNGSGKSNILDAICFVMGIKSLEQMRVTKVDELIYKQGQSGITKASVTVVFDNSDPKYAPTQISSETLVVSRQIVVGGKDKYLVNGHTYTASQVSELFKSCKLNVNNPHFLVMQGRIVKVISMKPTEIFSLIEESAGTKLYDEKRKLAERKIQSKQVDLDKIELRVKEEFEPTMASLKEERERFIRCNQIATECETLRGVLSLKIAEEVQKACDLLEEEKNRLGREIDVSEMREIELTEIIRAKKNEGNRINIEAEKMENRPDLIKLKQELEILENDKSTRQGKIDFETQRIASVRSDLRKIEKEIVKTEKEQKKFENENKKMVDEFNLREEKFEETKNLIQLTEEKVSKIRKGGAVDDKFGAVDLRDLITSKENDQNSIEGLLSTLRKQQKSKLDTLKELMQSSNSEESTDIKSTVTRLEAELASCDRRIKTYESKLRQAPIDESQISALNSERCAATDKFEQLDEQLRRLECSFEIERMLKLHELIQERSKLAGPAFELFSVKEECLDLLVPLDLAGGPKLKNVAVRDAKVADELIGLIRRRNLKFRVSTLPMASLTHQMDPRDIEKMNTAKSIKPGRNLPAIECVDPISKDFDIVLREVFGSSFVCDNKKSAQSIAFDNRMRLFAFDNEGNTYDPRGSLTGGAPQRNRAISVMQTMQEYRTLRLQHEAAFILRNKLSVKFDEITQKKSIRDQLMSALEEERHKYESTEERLKISVDLSNSGRVEMLQQELTSLEAQIIEQESCLSEIKKAIEEISVAIHNFDKQKKKRASESESLLKKLKGELKVVEDEKRKASESQRDFFSKRTEFEYKIGELKNKINEKNQETEQYESTIKALQEIETAAVTLRKDLSNKISSLVTENQNIRTKLIQLNEEVAEMTEELASISVTALKGQLKLVTQELKEKVQTRKQKSKKKVPDEFANLSSHDIKNRLDLLSKEKGDLMFKFSKDILTRFQTASDQMADLMKGKEAVERDRDDLFGFIECLENEKKCLLTKSFQSVDEHLSSIFSTLLSGSDAKLVLVNPHDFSKGAELRVRLGGVWKMSLTELSGGQKSLLALSLILSLLKVNPAPVYIFDEVDAALDLSHTRNMGRMIKTFFQESQFIVVSLQENLFQNADVLFRTSFANGSSQVARIDKLNNVASIEEDENELDQKENRRQKAPRIRN